MLLDSLFKWSDFNRLFHQETGLQRNVKPETECDISAKARMRFAGAWFLNPPCRPGNPLSFLNPARKISPRQCKYAD